MLNELTINDSLYQKQILYDIKDKFGEEFVYINENGNYAIEKKVLTAFKKIINSDIKWDNYEKCWR